MIPPEPWNRLGTKLIPNLRSGDNLQLIVEATVDVPSAEVENKRREIEQALSDLGLTASVRIETG